MTIQLAATKPVRSGDLLPPIQQQKLTPLQRRFIPGNIIITNKLLLEEQILK